MLDAADPSMAAAYLVHDAALKLAVDADEAVHRDYYLNIAARLGSVIDASPTRSEIMAASPQRVGPSGLGRSLVEIIEDEPGEESGRFRLAVLLMRVLTWDPTAPTAALDVIQHNLVLLRYQRSLIDRKLDEIRRSRGSNVEP